MDGEVQERKLQGFPSMVCDLLDSPFPLLRPKIEPSLRAQSVLSTLATQFLLPISPFQRMLDGEAPGCFWFGFLLCCGSLFRWLVQERTLLLDPKRITLRLEEHTEAMGFLSDQWPNEM